MTIYSTTGQPVVLYDTVGNAVLGQPPAPPPQPSPPSGPTRNIASWCNATNRGRAVANRDAMVVTTVHPLAVDVIDPRLVWVQTVGVGQEVGATFAVEASVNGGTTVPVTVGGSSTFRMEIPTGITSIISDPVPLSAFAGDKMHITVTTDADGSSGNPPGAFTGPQSPHDLAGNAGYALRPARVEAPSDMAAWVAVGDSIAQGSTWANELTFLDLALDAIGVPYVKTAQGGDAHVYYPARWGERMAPYLGTASHVIDQFGINSHGQMHTAGLAFWNYARANGVTYLVKTTLSPTTLEGDTLNRAGAQVDNAWLRDGAPVTADGTTALSTGTTDPTALRCDVILPDGTIQTGTGGHPLDAVSDTAQRIESSPGYLSAEAAAVAGPDRLHHANAVHAMLADRLARDLAILGF